MKNLTIVLLLTTLIFGFAVSQAWALAPPGEPGEVRELSQGNNEFSLRLYKILSKKEKGNIFCSPYSVSTALAMVYGGARGKTADQMAKVLCFPQKDAKLHQAYGKLIMSLNSRGQEGKFKLNVANRLWGQKGYKFLAPYLKLTKEVYGAGLQAVNFKQNPNGARETINRWVEKVTNNKIKNLLPPGSVDSMTRLILTNAVYFLGEWQYPFEKEGTSKGDFFTLTGGKVEIDMMHNTKHLFCGKFKGGKILEMLYKGGDISMVIILPDKNDGLPDLEKNITWKGVNQWLLQLKVKKARVTIPKFKSTSTFMLSEVLSTMGMNTLFGAGADLSGISKEKGIFISAIVHKAFVAVDEKGTEAAAATAVVMAGSAAPRPEKIFIFEADHPFIYLIRDRRTGSILFIGRLVKPVKS